MKIDTKQSGATLIVSLLMLVVLTVLVVSAIRSGTTNLHIVGNMQVQTEAAAVAQQAIEQVIATDFTAAPAMQTKSMTIGAVTYTVQVAKPNCIVSAPVLSTDKTLHPSPQDPQFNIDDQSCFGGTPQTPTLDAVTGMPLPVSSQACSLQVWEIQAGIDDASTGVKTTAVQGVGKRFYQSTVCP